MLAIISYLEKQELDWEIHNTLNDAFQVDTHFYISETPVDTRWEDASDYPREHFFKDIHFAVACLEANYVFVNVQRARTFEKAGYDWFRLHDFKHPENACYIFGPNYSKPELIRGVNVSIDSGRGSLHTVSAMAMVLYSRDMKWRTSTSV